MSLYRLSSRLLLQSFLSPLSPSVLKRCYHGSRLALAPGSERVPIAADAPSKSLPSPRPVVSPSPHSRADELKIGEVLALYKTHKPFTIASDSPLLAAIQLMVNSRIGCLLITDQPGKSVEGLLTERDVLKVLAERPRDAALAALNEPIQGFMTPAESLLHVHPCDSTSACLSLMCAQGVRHLPVLEEGGGLKGMVSMRNIVDVLYRGQLEEKGAKSMMVSEILPRIGLPAHTPLSLRPPSSFYLNSGVCSIPHPDKKEKGGEDAYVIVNRGVRAQPDNQLPNLPWLPASLSSSSPSTPSAPATSASAPAADNKKDSKVVENGRSESKKKSKSKASSDPLPSTSASSSPVSSLSSSSAPLPPSSSTSPEPPPLSVIAVFDGVGSWSFEQGIDPAQFAKALAQGLLDSIRPNDRSLPTPLSLLNTAYRASLARKAPGSSTACVLVLSAPSNELRAINVGDSGFLVLRQTKMGSMGPLHAQSSYQIIYRSPQQLHYFNCPFQLGADTQGNSSQFEQPSDAEQCSVSVQEGDLIILATDGLFDNLSEADVLGVLGERDEYERDLGRVAKRLTERAYEASLDRMIDSPFALLAKDNNIMWGGGRKDDITVIVSRVQSIPPA